MDKVYIRRILRKGKYFISKKLGAFGAHLFALSNFFDPPWIRPVDGLKESDKAEVLGNAGFNLRGTRTT